MSKKGFVVSAFLGVMLIMMSFSAVPGASAATTLTYSCFFPPTHIQSILAEQWSQEVEKRTNGEVKVQYYPGQSLTKADQCYDGVVQHISDIGFSVLAYTRGRFPVMSAVDLPLGYMSGRAATAVINAVYEKFNPVELQDTKVMYLHAHGPGLIHTKGKAVRKLEDMKGLKFRGHGTSADVVKALGGTPVPKPMPETYEMLQKGVVDGGVYPLESNKGWKLGEVVDYCTADFTSAYTTSFFVVMNKDKWAEISPENQKIIEEINAEWVVKHAEAWDTSDMEGLRYLLNQGGEMIGLDAKEAARWKAAVQPIIDGYVTELDKKGLNGKEIVEFIAKTLEKEQQ
ncbi:Extracellular solute-binding protein, family 7 [uncultured Desulfatiglans sp.]|nr:Extracellular solute-binding protein, family 7 [uncultured Desulfatiglans sp.]